MKRHSKQILWLFVLMSTACCVGDLSGAEDRYFTTMPPPPTDPKDYICKWDTFALRAIYEADGPYLAIVNRYNQSYTREILDSPRESFPLVNGRQIARDSLGRWFVIVEKDSSLFLATGHGPRIKGGDLAVMELIGRGPKAVLSSPGEVIGASMVVDGNNHLHIVWWSETGLWYVMSTLEEKLELLHKKEAWTEPRQLVTERCHPGDIMLDAEGKVVVCYSRDDTVYYKSIADGKVETAAGRGAGLPALPGSELAGEIVPEHDDAKPDEKPTRRRKQDLFPPMYARESQRSVMDLAPDGSVYLAFERNFKIWVTSRKPKGGWSSVECVAHSLAFHPAIIVTNGGPLICFQFEGIKNIALNSENYLREREGGGSSIGFAFKTKHGWRTGYLAKAEEIIVNRQGIWGKRFEGKLIPMLEQMGRPVLFRDRHGVAWALWQNTTRRWAYCARWMGENFGQVQECRGPFNAPGLAVSAEKHMPATATDVGVLFVSAHRIIFDRLKIPTLSLNETRQVMFLDSLEVGATSGLEFVLNEMTKHPENPVLSPGPPGSKDERDVLNPSVRKHGSTYVMTYSYRNWEDDTFKGPAWAVSADGVHWKKVAELPKDLPPPHPIPNPGPENPLRRGYYDNPDQSDPMKKYIRITKTDAGPKKMHKLYILQYSPDGKTWTDGPEISIMNSLRENAMPNLWDTLDIPERRLKIYGRAYTANARSCGVMWNAGDLLRWAGLEHFLDPDDPYGKPPTVTDVTGTPYTMRAQIFLDACAGKGEDQIYACDVKIVEGLYLCGYWPCTPEHRMDYALAVSRDGLNFTRVKNGARTLPVGPAGAWDSGYVFQWTSLPEGDNLLVYYRGTTQHHGTDEFKDRSPDQIGLAKIRVNGWTYYTPSPNDGVGTLTTIPIQAPTSGHKRLTVNIEGTAGRTDAFAVEVLDAATERPIRGFGKADCICPTSDGLAVPIRWKAAHALPMGKDIKLRFHLRGKGVRFYSFGFQPVE